MGDSDVVATGRVAGGALLQSLDLPAVTAQREASSPGMLTEAERALLTEIVRRAWRGDGAILDGGSFLGSSLVAEAQGVAASSVFGELPRANFPAGKPIHGYELGHHPAPANPAADRHRTYGGVTYRLGETFVPILERNIAAHRELIELHIGDLTDMAWPGSPIEMAFIDVCKTPALNAHVAKEFYPALIGGGSTLIHQDFFFDRLPWIRVTMGYLADYFRWEGQVATSSVYSNVKPVPRHVAAHDPFTEATLEECLAYHDAVAHPGIDRAAQLMLALSRVQLILHKGTRDHALEELRATAVEFVDLLGTQSQVASYRPKPGSPDSGAPRFRMDRAINEVLRGVAADGARGAGRIRATGHEEPSELDRARAALGRRDWDAARRILEPLTSAGRTGPATLLLARTELESGQPEVGSAILDEFLERRPRHRRARALRARARLAAGEHALARADAEEVLVADPELVEARRVLFDLEVLEDVGARERGAGT